MVVEVNRLSRHTPEEYQHLGQWSRPTQGSAPLEIALVFHIQNRNQLEQKTAQGVVFSSREEFLRKHGLPTSLLARTKRWLMQSGLQVTEQDDFSIWARGTFDTVARVFQIGFSETYHLGRRKFRPESEPTLPDWLQPYVLSLVGLDNVGELHPKHRQPRRDTELANGNQGFFPADIQRCYQVPPGLDGSGVTIGILEFSNGFAESDLQAFWSSFNIPAPTVEFVSVDGTPNDGGVSAQDMECTLDVEWAGAMAPGARLVVYEASAGSSDRSFGLSVLKNLRFVLNDSTRQPSVVTISYGDGESRFAAAVMQAWDSTVLEMNAKGMTVFVASGDEGAYGLHGIGLPIRHVDTPANVPQVVAVGGTHLTLDGQGQIANETGWTDTNDNGASGGGISQIFSVPAYQTSVALPLSGGTPPGRGVPDVALNADPDTGYAIVFQNAATVVGGTSAASPIWAAFTALLNQQRASAGKSPIGGGLLPGLYQSGASNSGAFRDITVGNNSYFGVLGYSCTPGWDAVTGWGSPHVGQWIQAWS